MDDPLETMENPLGLIAQETPQAEAFMGCLERLKQQNRLTRNAPEEYSLRHEQIPRNLQKPCAKLI